MRGGKANCTAHTWNAWKTTKKATVTATGTRERTCKLCGKKETGTVAKLVVASTTKPTVTTNSSPSSSAKTTGIKLDIPQKYWYDQNDYKKFLNSKGQNVGCSATALATVRSFLSGKEFLPTSVPWNGGVANWAPGSRIDRDTADGYELIYRQLQKGKPTIIKVRGRTDAHWVTIYAVDAGIEISKLNKKSLSYYRNLWKSNPKTERSRRI